MDRRTPSLVVLAAYLCATLSAQAVDIVVDCDQRYQQMEGIGAHLYNWSSYTKNYYTTPEFLNDYLGDLGNSMVRFEMHPNLCQAELPLADMEDYANYTMDLGDDGVAWVCTTLANIVTRDPSVKVIGTVWAPPAWMKDNGQTCCGGHLQPAYYEHYARYLYQWYTFLQNEFGVTLYAMSTQNELRFYEPYNSCIYDPQTYRDMMKVVGAYFDSKGCPVKFFGPEDMTHWADKVVEFVDAIMEDPEARDDLDIIATHGYLDGVVSGGGTPEENMELYLRTRQHGLPYWMTETSGEDWHWEDGLGFNSDGTPREGALNGLATKMHTSFVYGFCSGWTYWAYGGPGSTGAYGFSPTPGDMKYVAHKHYSKFIRPGAYRVAAAPDGQDGIWISAYYHEGNGTLTLVALNVGDTERTTNLRINDVTVNGGLTMYRTTADETFYLAAVVPVGADNGSASVVLPARSMVTLTGSVTAGNPADASGAPGITMDAPATSSTTLIPVTLTIDKNFGYYSLDGATYTQFDMVYDGGQAIVPITQTATLHYFASDGVDSTQIYTQQFTIASAGSEPYHADAQGNYEIEAENYFEQTAGAGAYASYQWEKRTGPVYTWVMQALPNDKQVRGSENPGTDGPGLHYRVNFTAAGTHYIWIRGTGPSSSDHWYNSTVSYGIDGSVSGSKKFVLEMGTGIYENKLRYDYMQWQRGTINVAGAGEHRVSFWMKADGFKLDKCILTTDGAYTPPSYIEPPEVPTGTAVSDISVSRMTVSWNPTPRAYGYRLYYRNATTADSWSWGNQIELDSATTSYIFATVDGDSLHANTAYVFNIAAIGPQKDSHNWEPQTDSASGTTLTGGNGGFVGFEPAAMKSYPIPGNGDFVNQGYRWTYEGTSSELSSLGSTEGVFDRACVFYGDGSRVYSEAIPGGFGSVSFTIGRHGYPSGGQFVVRVNDAEVARTHQLDWSTNDHFTYNFPGVNVTGDVVITIHDITPTNGNDSRGSFDDLRWSGFHGGAPSVPTDVNAMFGDSGLTVSCTPVDGARGYRVYAQGVYPEQYVLAATATGADGEAILADPRLTGPMVLRMTAYNDSAESAWSDSVLGLAYHCGATEHGLYAYYYDGKSFAGDAYERVDTAIAFPSWTTEPAPGVGTSDFSIIWVGDVEAEYTETYTFHATYDDGARLWVNGELLVDDWAGGGSRETSGTIDLQAGQRYHLMMQYFQGGGGGKAELRWSSPSTAKQLIPSARLTTGPSCTPPVAAGAPGAARTAITAACLCPQRHGFTFVVPHDQAFRLAVYDMSGRLVTRRSGHRGGSYFVTTATLPAGLYVVRLAAGHNVLTKPLVVRR